MVRGKRSTQQAKLEDVNVSTKRSRGEASGDEASEPEEPRQEQKEPTSREDLFKRRQAKLTGIDEPAKTPANPKPKDTQAKEQPKTEAAKDSHSTSGIWVNRAPVLTLWVAVVAQRQGFSRDAGLTFGKAIAGLLAQSKGRAIGVYEDKEKDEGAKAAQTDKEEEAGVEKVDVFGMHIKGVKASKGEGQQGWGRKGLLELEKLQELKP
ncbi:hypothetical protein WJX73_008527 [Symbiochloris irregularis]|uniref:Uncharacterized protein n=1 Tax=Symbiochloris irregularis TaxID=706552 RepID=A0AAW1NMI2_9CHLO